MESRSLLSYVVGTGTSMPDGRRISGPCAVELAERDWCQWLRLEGQARNAEVLSHEPPGSESTPPAILFDMMQTLANYSRPFPDQWFQALARLCQESAQLVQSIGHANPSLTAKEKEDINKHFQAKDYNVALIGEEVTRGSADLVGGWLYTINNLLDGPFVSPVTIAPIARAAIETSAQIAYLNSFGPIERCFWAMRAVTDKIDYEKERDLVPGAFPRLKKATKVHTAQHRGTKLDFPSNTKLVRETLKDIDGCRMYKETSAYTHQHAWTAYKHSNYVMHKPLLLELRTIRFILDTLAAADYAARSFVNYRNKTMTATAYSSLDILLGNRKSVHKVFEDWMAKNNVAPAP